MKEEIRIAAGDKQVLTPTFTVSQTLEEDLFVGENATLHYYIMDSVEGIASHKMHIHQAANSTFVFVSLTASGNMDREIWLEHEGEGCSTIINGIGIGKNEEKLSFITHVVHALPHGTSQQLYKYILDDHSVGTFFGELIVKPGAQKTSAYQTNRNLLRTSTARINTKPQLEIYADDVKCSHGATTGQLDESALFYMQQRGIPRDKAQLLMMNAFAMEVLEVIEEDEIKTLFQQQVGATLEQPLSE